MEITEVSERHTLRKMHPDSMPVIRTLARVTESFAIYSIDFFPDIRTLYAIPNDVLITDIHCITLAENDLLSEEIYK